MKKVDRLINDLNALYPCLVFNVISIISYYILLDYSVLKKYSKIERNLHSSLNPQVIEYRMNNIKERGYMIYIINYTYIKLQFTINYITNDIYNCH